MEGRVAWLKQRGRSAALAPLFTRGIDSRRSLRRSVGVLRINIRRGRYQAIFARNRVSTTLLSIAYQYPYAQGSLAGQ